jgi:LmbE family N-acetylglucosaminyl deacetylase
MVPINGLGTVLGVWAHPDDEAYLSAGVMAQARAAGQRVIVATATYGELGAADGTPPARLAAIRRHELAASLAAVGVTEHRWLGYADGGCADVDPASAVARVAGLIAEVGPDTILTFGPDGMTGHPDHQAVSAWTTAAWRSAGCPGRLMYATVTPADHAQWQDIHDRFGGVWMVGNGPAPVPEEQLTVHLRLADEALDRKLVALRAQASQTTGLIQAVGSELFARLCATEAFVAAENAR